MRRYYHEKIDKNEKRLCDIQTNLFEKSTDSLNISSKNFVRRFMNSKIAIELNNNFFWMIVKELMIYLLN